MNSVHVSMLWTNLNISFLTVRLAVSISLLVFALLLLTGGAFPFITSPLPVLPPVPLPVPVPVPVPVLLPLLVLLLLLLVAAKLQIHHIVMFISCNQSHISRKGTADTYRLGDGDLDGFLFGDRDVLRLRLCLLRGKRDHDLSDKINSTHKE